MIIYYAWVLGKRGNGVCACEGVGGGGQRSTKKKAGCRSGISWDWPEDGELLLIVDVHGVPGKNKKTGLAKTKNKKTGPGVKEITHYYYCYC